MSACISQHGEYGEHTPDAEYTCALCGVLDEEALLAELRDLRTRAAEHDRQVAERAAAQALRDAAPGAMCQDDWARLNRRADSLAPRPAAPVMPERTDSTLLERYQAEMRRSAALAAENERLKAAPGVSVSAEQVEAAAQAMYPHYFTDRYGEHARVEARDKARLGLAAALGVTVTDGGDHG